MPKVRTRGTPERLLAWVRRQREAAAEQADQSSIDLVHASGSRVAQWRGHETKDDAIADAILQIAQDDCDGRESLANYELRWLIEGEQRGVYPVRCKPHQVAVTESPDLSGMLTQQMRHNEALARLLVTSLDTITQGQAQLFHRMDSILERLDERRDRAEEERDRIEAELRESGDDEDRKPTAVDRIAEALEPALPQLIAGLLGAPAADESEGA